MAGFTCNVSLDSHLALHQDIAEERSEVLTGTERSWSQMAGFTAHVALDSHAALQQDKAEERTEVLSGTERSPYTSEVRPVRKSMRTSSSGTTKNIMQTNNYARS
jgi:hypothetical protein